MKHTRPVFAIIASILAVFAVIFTGQVDELATRTKAGISLKQAAEEVSYTTGNGLFTRRFVIATAATYAYADFVRNLACSLAPRHLLVLALDSKLPLEKMPMNVKIVHFDANSTTNIRYQFGSAAFAMLSRRKLAAARAVLEVGYDVLFTDADVVWCDSEMVHEIADSVIASGNEMMAQRAAVRGQIINSGLYYAKMEASQLLEAAEKWSRRGDDQWALNNVACERRFGGERLIEDDVVTSCNWNNSTRVGFLEEDKYPLGCTSWNGNQIRTLDKSVVRGRCREKQTALLHYSCWSGGHKRKSMAARGMWLVDEKSGACK